MTEYEITGEQNSNRPWDNFNLACPIMQKQYLSWKKNQQRLLIFSPQVRAPDGRLKAIKLCQQSVLLESSENEIRKRFLCQYTLWLREWQITALCWPEDFSWEKVEWHGLFWFKPWFPKGSTWKLKANGYLFSEPHFCWCCSVIKPGKLFNRWQRRITLQIT